MALVKETGYAAGATGASSRLPTRSKSLSIPLSLFLSTLKHFVPAILVNPLRRVYLVYLNMELLIRPGIVCDKVERHLEKA